MEITLEEWILIISALALAGVFIIISTIMALGQLVDHVKLKRQSVVEVKLEEILDTLSIEVLHAKPKNYRHNIHCPTCGRFSKKVWGTTSVIECSKHGVEVVWKEVDVEWLSRPISETEVFWNVDLMDTSPHTIIPEMTDSLDIVIPDYVDNIQWRPSTNMRRQIQLIPQ